MVPQDHEASTNLALCILLSGTDHVSLQCSLRACSFCTYSGLGIQTELRIRVPFGKTEIGIVFRFWFINQARAGLPWFMSVYHRREPDNSSKIAQRYNYKQVGRNLFLCWSIDVFVPFPVFVSSLENNLLCACLP